MIKIDIKKAIQAVKDALSEKNKTVHQRNFEKRWELVGFKKPSVHVKQPDGSIKEHSMGHHYINKDGKRVEIQVPIFQSKNWSSNKYNGQKLREIRAKQTADAISGQTHFTDGTVINKSQLVDMWS